MNKDNIRDIVYLILAIVVSIIAVKVFIWLLPVILIIILALYIYGKMKTDKKDNVKRYSNKSKKSIIIDREDNK